MKTTSILSLSFSLTLAGCEVPELETPQASAPAQQPPALVAESSEAAAKAPSTEDPRYNRNDPGAASATPRKATGFDGKKGKLSRREGGYLGTVLGSGMYAQHQAIFLQVEQAINLDYGLNGAFPKSHEEFMERVIKFNNIQLPELSEGDEYLYDPEDHTLKIWRPGDAESQQEDTE